VTSKEQRREAIEVAIARGGGIIAFSKAMSVTHQAVTSWRKKARVPLPRAMVIEHLYGVGREHLIDPAIAEALLTPSAADVI